MAITNGYCTLAALKAELRLTDSTDDTRLEQVVEAVSRQIDDHCGFPERHFYQTSSGTVRYFTAESARVVFIDDVTTVTAVETDASGDGTFETSLTVTTHYLLAPFNAAGVSEPYTRIELAATSGRRLPAGVPRGIKITGTWGWPATPETVTQACLIQSARIFKRAEAPFGVAAIPALDGAGIQLRAKLDPDVEQMLRRVRRAPVAV